MRPFEKIYVKDFDGNILNAPTSFYFEQKQSDGTWKEVEVSAHDYDNNRVIYDDINKYRFVGGDAEITYQNFRDYFEDHRHKLPKKLSEDIAYAIDNGDFAPSFNTFKEKVLVNGELFSLLTARGNSPDNLRVGMQLISERTLDIEQKEQQIENIKKKYQLEKLTDTQALQKYFDVNCYLPINNVQVKKFLSLPDSSSPDRKVSAMKRYINYIADFIRKYQKLDSHTKVKLGFSDDALENVVAMMNFFGSIYKNYKNIGGPYDLFDYKLYYTGKEIDFFTKTVSDLEEEYKTLRLLHQDKSTNNGSLPIRKLSFSEKL